jgi:hypothetical protein
MCGASMSGFDGEDDLFRLAIVGIMEVQAAIDPPIRTLLLLYRAGADQSECPPLEFVRIRLGQCSGIGNETGSPSIVYVPVIWSP